MHISDQPYPFLPPQPYASDATPPAPIASTSHASQTGKWNPLVPIGSDWMPRGRRATHRATGRH